MVIEARGSLAQSCFLVLDERVVELLHERRWLGQGGAGSDLAALPARSLDLALVALVLALWSLYGPHSLFFCCC